MIVAFDADVLIYAASPDHSIGTKVAGLLGAAGPGEEVIGVGSVLLLPEVLAKPLRTGTEAEVAALTAILARLDLLPFDESTARLATVLAGRYRLRAADAAHLATAVAAGADRFLTGNRKDFPREITEVEVVYGDELS